MTQMKALGKILSVVLAATLMATVGCKTADESGTVYEYDGQALFFDQSEEGK